METIAVYWESRAKTYGFDTVQGLSLLQLAMQSDGLVNIGALLQAHSSGKCFKWVLAQPCPLHGIRLFMALKQEDVPGIEALVNRAVEGGAVIDTQTTHPVALINFHGPHFGDRYGIADAALGTLRRKGLPILAAGCSGASVYLAVPDKLSADVITILSKVFESP